MATIYGNANQLSGLRSYFQNSAGYYGSRYSYPFPDFCRDLCGYPSNAALKASQVALNLGAAAGSFRGQSLSIDQTVRYSSGKEEKEKREEQKNDNAFMFGAIALVVSAATLAYTWGNFTESRKALKEASDAKEILSELGKKDENNHKFFHSLQDLFKENVEVTQTRYANSRDWFGLNVVFLGTAASAVLGSQLSIRWLVTTSKIVSVFTLAAAAFLLVYRWNDKTSLSLDKQEELIKAVKDLTPKE